jgi:anti-sigma regulatory factor (Ser/Thr protein kinase)
MDPRSARCTRMVWSLSCFLTCRIPVLAAGGQAWPDPRRVGVEVAVTASSSDRFGHLALFYHGRGEYLAALRGYIQASRARGDAVFVAVPKRNTQLVHQKLGVSSAHVTVVDMAELGRNPARIIPALQAYAGKHPGQHVCCIGEPIWPGRTAAETREAIRHEALINLAFRGSLVTVVCPYDSARLPGSVIADAVRTHPAVIKDRQATASVSYQGPPDLPPRCNRALSRPPVHAETLGYSDDLSPVRRFVASRATCAGLTPSRIPDLVLAIGELAANTVRHTDGGGSVQVWQTGGEFICQVADTGHFTDPLAWHRPPSDELLGGNGLWVVNQVCDLVQARTGQAGTTIRLHMRLNRHPPRRHASRQTH